MKKITFIAILGIFILFQPINAQTWTASKRLTWNSGQSLMPKIVTDSSNRIHVVWYDNTPGNAEVYYKQSTNAGTTWGFQKRLTWNSSWSGEPIIVVDSINRIHLVWRDYTPGNSEIYYRRSTDGGTTWTGPKRLTWNSTASFEPSIAADSNNHLHMVWFDGSSGSYDIFYKKSTDGGSTWTSSTKLTWNPGESRSPTIAVDSNNHLHVVWFDGSVGDWEIFYKRSTDGGTTWIGQKRLTWNPGLSERPAIAADSNDHLHVAWFDDNAGNWDVYYRRSTNGGTTWESSKRLTWNSGDSWSHSIGVDTNDHLHVVWNDDSPGNFEVYYKKSTNGGTTWGSLKRLTWNSGESESAALTVDSSNHLHVVWVDNTSGNQEIFFKKGIQ